jgi:hypothetical protein
MFIAQITAALLARASFFLLATSRRYSTTSRRSADLWSLSELLLVDSNSQEASSHLLLLASVRIKCDE